MFNSLSFPNPEVSLSTSTSGLNSHELVILDAGVDHLQQLIGGVRPDIDWVVLNQNQDGIEQITYILANYPKITTLHIVSHGAPGCLFLGNTQLNLNTLESYTIQLQSWFAASSPSRQVWGSKDLQSSMFQSPPELGDLGGKEPSLLLYGCNVAAGDAGAEFVNKLHNITQANIAASRTLTGNAQQGGNWNLEVILGNVKTELAFLPETQTTYSGVLNDGIISFDSPHFDYSDATTVSVAGDLAVVGAGENLIILDMSDPENPTEKATRWIGSWRQINDVLLVESSVFVATSSGVYITDISDPANPSDLYSHSAYGQNETDSISVVGNLAIINQRGDLRIVDISDPENPILKSDQGFGNNATENIAVAGNLMLVPAGTEGLKIVDISDPKNQTLKGSIDTNDDWGGGSAHNVAVAGDLAFVANRRDGFNGSDGLKIVDISDPENPTLKGSIEIDGEPRDVSVQGNYAFVADRLENLNIIDISDPENPTLKQSIQTAFSQSSSIEELLVLGNYAFIAHESEGLKIINLPVAAGLSFNDDPTAIALSNTSVEENQPIGTVIGDISTTDNDATDTHTLSLVAGEGDDDNDQFYIYNGKLKTKETFDHETKDSYSIRVRTIDGNLGSFEQQFTINVENISEAAKARITGDIEEDSPLTVEITDDDGISGTVNYQWQVSEDGTTWTDIVDATNSTFIPGGAEEGKYLQVNASYTDDGGNLESIRAVAGELGDPAVISSNIFSNRIQDVSIVDEYAFVVDFTEGLKIIDVSDPENPTLKGRLDTKTGTSSNPGGVSVVGDLAFVADGEGNGGGLKIVNISDLENPVLISSFDTDVTYSGISVVGDLAFASTADGLKIINISDPENPVLISSFDESNYYYRTIPVGNYAFAVTNDGFKSIDISDLENPTLADSIGFQSIDISVVGDLAFLARGRRGLGIIDISDPSRLDFKGSIETSRDALDVSVEGDLAFVATGYRGGLEIIDISDPENPTLKHRSYTDEIYNLSTVGDLAFVGTDEGLKILNINTVVPTAVANVNDTPTDVDLSNAAIAENSDYRTAVGTLLTTDPDSGDSHTYTLLDDAGGRFELLGEDQIVVADGDLLDYESTTSHKIRVRTTDQGGLSYEKEITIEVTQVNEAPTNISLSSTAIDENSADNTEVGTLSTTDLDQDGDSHTYTLINDAGGRFALSGDKIVVADGSLLDYENTTSHTIRLRSTDQGGISYEKNITISVVNVNEAPEVNDQNFSVGEDVINGTTVGTVVADDVDGDNLTYSITAGNQDGIFAINETTGRITIADSSQLDFETTNSYDLTVEASDSLTGDSATVTVNITDANDAPEIDDQSFSVGEDATNGTTVGTVTADDIDGDDLTYSITAGNNNGIFAIDEETGKITIADSSQLDFETTDSYDLTVEASDSLTGDSATVTIEITNANDAPDINDQSFSVAEDVTDGVEVGTVTADDVDGDDLTYSITAGNEDGIFAIDETTGKITIADSSQLDFETTNSYDLTVEASDSVTGDSATVTVNITDANDAPELSSTAPTNATQGSAYTYNIVIDDPDAVDDLTITASTLPNWLTLTDNGDGTATLTGTPDNTEVGDHTVELQVEDSAGEIDTQSFTVTVKNTNDAPTIVGTPDTTIDEDSNYSFVPTADDLDGDGLSFSIQNKPDWATFDSATGELSGIPENEDVGTTENIVISVTDGTETVALDAFNLEVININNAPTNINLSSIWITEDWEGGIVGTLTTEDVDSSNFSYSVDDDRFEVVLGVLKLKSGESVNYETEPNIAVNVTSTDDGNPTESLTQSFTIKPTKLPDFARQWLDNAYPNVEVEITANRTEISYQGDFDVSEAINQIAEKLDLGSTTQSLQATNPSFLIKGDLGNPADYQLFVGEISPSELINFLAEVAGTSLSSDVQSQLNNIGNASFTLSKRAASLTYLEDLSLDLNQIFEGSNLVQNVINKLTANLLGDGDSNSPGTQLVLSQPQLAISQQNGQNELSLSATFNGQEVGITLTEGEITGLELSAPDRNALKQGLEEELPEFIEVFLDAFQDNTGIQIAQQEDEVQITYLGDLDLKSIVNSLSSALDLGTNFQQSLLVTNPGLTIKTDENGDRLYEVSVAEMSPNQVINFLTEAAGTSIPSDIQSELNVLGNVSFTLSKQGVSLTYLDDLTLDINSIVETDGFVQDFVNNLTAELLGDGNSSLPGTQLVLSEPQLAVSNPNDKTQLNLAGTFNGQAVGITFDQGEISSLEIASPDREALKQSLGNNATPFANAFVDALEDNTGIQVTQTEDEVQITYLGNLDLKSIINTLSSELGLGSFTQSLLVTNPGLTIKTDENGDRLYEVSVDEMSPNQVINFLTEAAGTSIPAEIQSQLNALGNVGFTLSKQGISLNYLDDLTLDLNSITDSTNGGIQFIQDAVNTVAEQLLGDGDRNQPGTQLVLAQPQIELIKQEGQTELNLTGILNDREAGLSFKDGETQLNYELPEEIDLSSLVNGVPVLGLFTLKDSELIVSRNGFNFIGNVDFSENTSYFSEFVHNQLGVETLGVEIGLDPNTGATLVGDLTGNIPLFSSGDFSAILNSAGLKLAVDPSSATRFGILGDLTLAGYDPFQDNEPALTLVGELALDPKAITGSFSLDPESAWENPFGIPDTEIRNLAIQLGGTYLAPYIDNVGFIGDVQFGNYDIASAFLVDSNDPNKFGLELTANQSINLLDLMSGPMLSYGLKQASGESNIVKDTLDFLNQVIDVQAISIDGPDADKDLDPLIKFIPVNTKIANKTFEQGVGINGKVTAWGAEATLNLEANPFSTSPSLEGSLQLPEINLFDLIKIQGLDGSGLNLEVKADADEQYLKGNGRLNLFGYDALSTDFTVNEDTFELKKLNVDLGILDLNASNVLLNSTEQTASGRGYLTLFDQYSFSTDFKVDQESVEIDRLNVYLEILNLEANDLLFDFKNQTAEGRGRLALFNRYGFETDFKISQNAVEVGRFNVDLGALDLNVNNLSLDYKNRSASGEGTLELFGKPVANTSFGVTPSSILVKDFDFDFGILTLDTDNIYFSPASQRASGQARLEILGQKAVDTNFRMTQDTAYINNLDVDFGLLGLNANNVMLDISDQAASGKGSVEILGKTVANTAFDISKNRLNISDLDLNLGLVKLDVDNLSLTTNPDTASGKGTVEIIGRQFADIAFDVTQNSLTLKDLDLDFGVLALDVDNLSVNASNQSLSGRGDLEILGKEVVNADFTLTPTHLTVNDFDVDFGILSFDADNFTVSTKSASASGKGSLEILGQTFAQTDFTATSNSLTVKDFDLDFGFVDLDIDNLSVKLGEQTASGRGQLKVFGQTIAGADFNISPNQLTVKDFSLGFGNILSFKVDELKINSKIDSSDYHPWYFPQPQGFATGEVRLFGQKIAGGSFSIYNDRVYVSHELAYKIAGINVGVAIDVSLGSRNSATLTAYLGDLRPSVTLDLGSSSSITSIADWVKDVVLDELGIVGDAVRYALDAAESAVNWAAETANKVADAIGDAAEAVYDNTIGWLINSYIEDAEVFFDANFNGIRDFNEPFTLTEADGSFKLPISLEQYDLNQDGVLDHTEGLIVGQGGTYVSSGLPLETPLIAIPSYEVVTPLTTLVAELVMQGIEPEAAEAQVKLALGLPADIDLGTFNYLDAAANGDPNGLKVYSAVVQVQNIIVTATKLLEGAAPDTAVPVANATIEAIAAQIQNSQSLDLSQPETLDAILNATISRVSQLDAEIDTTQLSEVIAIAVQAMAQSNQLIQEIANSEGALNELATDITRIQKVALGDIAESLSQLAVGTKTIEALMAEITPEAIQAILAETVVSDPTFRPEVVDDASEENIVEDAESPTDNSSDPNNTGSSNLQFIGSVIGSGSGSASETNDFDVSNSIPEIITPVQPAMAEMTTSVTEATVESDMIIGSGVEPMYLLDGHDTLMADSEDNWVNGNTGNDMMDVGAGNDTVHGGKDNDTVFGAAGNDWMNGNKGADFIDGGEGMDTLYGGEDSDTLQGNAGNDWLSGNLGADFLNGGAGVDTIFGGQDNDTLQGNADNDELFGNIGADLMEGNDGNDLLHGGQDNDTISGNNGDDTVHGDRGNDLLDGGEGDDELFGDMGDDVLFGAAGNDTLTGGEGGDRFILTVGSGNNLITDFTDGEDMIVLEDGLTFEQLTLETAQNATVVKFNEEILATLNGIESGLITADDFVNSL